MRRAGLALAMIATCCSSYAHAASLPPEPWGIWSGEIGKQAVQVCFQKTSWGEFGAYYYLSHLGIIVLQPSHTGSSSGIEWSEDSSAKKPAASPRWMLRPVRNDRLTGTWTVAEKELPIALVRVRPSTPDGAACGDASFSYWRAVKPVITRSRKSVDGIGYTALIAKVGKHFDASLSSFQLDGAAPAIGRINAGLRATLPSRAEDSDYFGCMMSNLGSNGSDGEYGDDITPVLLTRRWMVIQRISSSSCGGAHPNYGVEWQTYDLAAGESVDLWTWLNPVAATVTPRNGYSDVEITPGLRTLLTQHWPRSDDDCSDVAEYASRWNVRLTREGFAFTPSLPHAGLACVDDVELSFAQLAPLLNNKGRTNVAAIRRDFASRRTGEGKTR